MALPTAPAPRPSAAAHLLALLLYGGLTLLYFRPDLHGLGDHLVPNLGDPLFNLWVLKWGAHKLRTGLAGLWDAPIFYPARRTLAYSDHLLGPAALVALLTALQVSPIAAYNLLLLGSFPLCGWSAWYVLARSGLPPVAAVFGGAAWTFSSFRWEQLSHIQLILAAAVPLVLWTFDRLLAERTWRRAALFLAVYAIHMTGGIYLAYMVHLPLLALVVNRLPDLRRRRPSRRELAALAAAAAGAAGVAAAMFQPYVLAWRGSGPRRGVGELRIWGASVLSYLTPDDLNLYGAAWPDSYRRPENALFAGFLPTAFAAVAVVEVWRRLRDRAAAPRPPGRRVAAVACTALAAAGWLLGELHTWTKAPPLAEFEELVPGGDYDLPLGLLLLGSAGWVVLRRPWRRGGGVRWRELEPWWRGLLLAGLACLALSQPILFDRAARLVPGLGGMRVPARFHVFVSFVVAALAAAGLAVLLARLRSPRGRAVAGGLALAALAIDLTPRRIDAPPLRPEDEMPPVYSWLAGRPEVRALLELPWNEPGAEHPQLRDIRLMYFGTRHWRPLVNGYSGYFPAHYDWLRGRCCWPAPEGEALAALRRWGVSHVLIHTRQLRRSWQRQALARWEGTAGVKRVYAREGDVVFRLLHAPSSPGAQPPAGPPPAPVPGAAGAPR
ncbi:MAG TPA: hypothetical protein VF121_15390 [Thermoanaerobaculia bacterium]|nr:hypothetical protein [Thermoanaerobaculia bacterium]